MKKFIKFVLIFLAGIIVLLVLVVAGVYLFVDPNDYKDNIAQYVQEQTGRNLEIKGDLSLSVFPWLGVKLGESSLDNPQGFEEPQFAKIQSAEVRVRIWPLVQKELEVGTISLKGFELDLKRTAKGLTNWQDLLPDKSTGKEKTSKTDIKDKGGPGGLSALAIGKLEILDARLSLDDKMLGKSLEVNELNLELGPVLNAKPFDIDLSFYFAGQDPDLKADMTLSTRAELDLQKQSFAFDNLEISSQIEGRDIPGQEAEFELKTDALVQMQEQRCRLQNLALNTYGLEIKGNVEASSFPSQPRFSGQLDLSSFDPQALFARMGMEKLETRDPKVLSKAGAKMKFSGSNKDFQLESLEAFLDETNIQGQASVSQFNKPDIEFKLQADALDADRYQPETREESESVKSKEEKQDTEKGSRDKPLFPALPLKTLRSMHLNGDLNVGKLKVNNLDLQDISLKLKAEEGIIKVDPLDLKLYQGRLNTVSSLDVRQKTPAVQLQAKLQKVRAKELLKDYAGKDYLSGTGDLDLDISTRGMTQNQLTRHLNGQLSFKFEDGAIKGINIPKLLRDNLKRLQGQKPDPTEVKETDFTILSASARITRGVLKNKDLLLSSPLLKARGAGSADLNQEQIDYALRTTIAEEFKGRGESELAKLAGLTIPISISGSFADPSIVPIFKEILPQLGLQKGLEQFKGSQELKDKIKGLRDKLQAPQESNGQETQDSKSKTSPQDLLEGLF